jgi:hypothetical protein
LGALPVVEGLLKSQRKPLLDAGGTRPPSPRKVAADSKTASSSL